MAVSVSGPHQLRIKCLWWSYGSYGFRVVQGLEFRVVQGLG